MTLCNLDQTAPDPTAHPCSPAARGHGYGYNDTQAKLKRHQRYCGTCALWQWDLCPEGQHDLKTEAELTVFYRREDRELRRAIKRGEL